MRNIFDEIDISQLKGIDKPVLPLWVYGTLRTGQQFHYYLVDCSAKVGEYLMDGTLMQMESGDVFVRQTGSELKTAGELYRVSIAGLWRIFHLENRSGSFPKAYDLHVSKIYEKTTGNPNVALWFRRREEEALLIQDYTKQKSLLEELIKHIQANPNIDQNGIDEFLREWPETPSTVCMQCGRDITRPTNGFKEPGSA